MREIFQPYYYIIVLFSLFYAFKKVGFNKISFLIIILFWEGLFQYLDSTLNLSISLHNFYKIFVVGYAVYITGDKLFIYSNRKVWHLALIFILFSISFWISYSLNGGDIITILSQYLYKYFLVFVLFNYFKDLIYLDNKREYINNVVLQVLYIQVFLSIIKFLITMLDQIKYGYNIEAIVGSISAGGAGLAVVLPIIALIFYWLVKNGNFTHKDWLVAFSFMMISMASGKRQPIILFPIFLYLLFTYVKKGTRILSTLKYLPLVFIIFIIGVKINPTLNPENKIWGSFDIKFVSDYVSEYYFGTQDVDYLLTGEYDYTYGRVGGATIFLKPAKMRLRSLDEILFGKDLYDVTIGIHGRFSGEGRAGFGIDNQGLIGEAGKIIYSLGYMGTFLIIIFSCYFIMMCRNKRIVIVLLVYFLWDFFFYYNQLVFSNQSAVVLLCIIFISFDSKQFSDKGSKNNNEKLIST